MAAARPGFGGPRLDSPRVVPAPGLRARELSPAPAPARRSAPRSGSLSTSIRPSERLHDPLRQRQPEAQPSLPPRAVAPPERVEDQRQGLRRDALALVLDREAGARPPCAAPRPARCRRPAWIAFWRRFCSTRPSRGSSAPRSPRRGGSRGESPSQRRCCRTPPAPRPAPRQESCCPRPRSRANRAGSARTGHPRGHRERRPNGDLRGVLTDRRGVVDDAVVDRLDHRPKAGQRRPQVVRDGRDRSRRWASTASSTARADGRAGERRPAPTPSE